MHEQRKCSQCEIILNGNSYLKHAAKHRGTVVKKKMTVEENIVHQIKNKVPCQCKFCNKDFEWINSMIRHEKICQESLKVENAFKYTFCDKSYKSYKSKVWEGGQGNGAEAKKTHFRTVLSSGLAICKFLNMGSCRIPDGQLLHQGGQGVQARLRCQEGCWLLPG